MVIIINDDEGALNAVPPRGAVVLVFLRARLTPTDMRRLSPIVASKLAVGGTGFVAKSMQDVMERL